MKEKEKKIYLVQIIHYMLQKENLKHFTTISLTKWHK